MSLNKLLSDDPKSLETILKYTKLRFAGDMTNRDCGVKLNEELGTNYTYETWSRYMALVFELDNLYSESQIENTIDRRKLQITQNHTRKMVTDIARKDIITESIVDYMNDAELVRYSRDEEHLPVATEVDVFISDLHYKDDAQFVHKFFDELGETYGYIPARLFINGDIVQGTLRLDDIYEGSIDVMEQVIQLASIIIDRVIDSGIQEIVVLPGNHDELRLTGYKGSNNPNVAKMLFAILNEALDIGVVYTDVFEDDDMRVQHGHQFRGKAKMIEFGKQYSSKYDKLCVMGHMHSPEQHERMIITPALTPSDSYAKSLNLYSSIGWTSIVNGAVKFHLWNNSI